MINFKKVVSMAVVLSLMLGACGKSPVRRDGGDSAGDGTCSSGNCKEELDLPSPATGPAGEGGTNTNTPAKTVETWSEWWSRVWPGSKQNKSKSRSEYIDGISLRGAGLGAVIMGPAATVGAAIALGMLDNLLSSRLKLGLSEKRIAVTSLIVGVVMALPGAVYGEKLLIAGDNRLGGVLLMGAGLVIGVAAGVIGIVTSIDWPLERRLKEQMNDLEDTVYRAVETAEAIDADGADGGSKDLVNNLIDMKHALTDEMENNWDEWVGLAHVEKKGELIQIEKDMEAPVMKIYLGVKKLREYTMNGEKTANELSDALTGRTGNTAKVLENQRWLEEQQEMLAERRNEVNIDLNHVKGFIEWKESSDFMWGYLDVAWGDWSREWLLTEGVDIWKSEGEE